MYLSYRWARHSTKAYVLGMVVSILWVSFVPAYHPVGGVLTIVIFPATFVSFPFYAYSLETRIWVEHDWMREYHYGASFLAVDIVPSTVIHDWMPMRAILALAGVISFFLLVNISGALLGYWIATRHRIEFFGSRWWKIPWGVRAILVGAVSLGLYYALFVFWLDIRSRVFCALFGFATFLLEAMILSYLLNNWTSILSIMLPEYEIQSKTK